MESKKPFTNWLDLPADIMIDIFHRLNYFDIFLDVQRVCTTWHKICKDPALWTIIHVDEYPYTFEVPYLWEIFQQAVNRSQGQLVDLTIVGDIDDKILRFIADRSSQLRRLELAYCSCRIWSEALKKFPLLEELNLYDTNISKEAIETAGRYCPLLKTLKVNEMACCFGVRDDKPVEESIGIGNEFAKAIGENLFGLRHLEVIGRSMSNVGLQVILDGCCHLESLDLRNCKRINLTKDLQKRCSEQIKHLKLPDDYIEHTHFYYYNIRRKRSLWPV